MRKFKEYSLADMNNFDPVAAQVDPVLTKYDKKMARRKNFNNDSQYIQNAQAASDAEFRSRPMREPSIMTSPYRKSMNPWF